VSEKYDPFGRPIEDEHPWAQPAEQERGGLPGGFLPPETPVGATDAPAPERPEAPRSAPAASPSSAPAQWPPLPGGATPAAPAPVRGAPPDDALASWGARFIAYLVDSFIVGVLSFGFAFAVAAIARSGRSASDVGDLAGVVAVIAVVPIWALYATASLAMTNGRTIGKRLCHLRVVQAGGATMTWGRAAMRELIMRGLVITVIGTITLGIAGILDVLWPLWDKQNRSLHDHGADTWVVRD
jgi:uncharacterized RDD family membrane protein YckC